MLQFSLVRTDPHLSEVRIILKNFLKFSRYFFEIFSISYECTCEFKKVDMAKWDFYDAVSVFLSLINELITQTKLSQGISQLDVKLAKYSHSFHPSMYYKTKKHPRFELIFFTLIMAFTVFLIRVINQSSVVAVHTNESFFLFQLRSAINVYLKSSNGFLKWIFEVPYFVFK